MIPRRMRRERISLEEFQALASSFEPWNGFLAAYRVPLPKAATQPPLHNLLPPYHNTTSGSTRIVLMQMRVVKRSTYLLVLFTQPPTWEKMVIFGKIFLRAIIAKTVCPRHRLLIHLHHHRLPARLPICKLVYRAETPWSTSRPNLSPAALHL